MSTKTSTVIDKLTKKILRTNLSGTTSFFAYQPTVPAGTKQFLDHKQTNVK